jgi:hypothetical protein
MGFSDRNGVEEIVRYATYSLANGRILQTGDCHPSEVSAQKMEGEGVIPIFENRPDFIKSHYLKDGAIIERPAMPLSVSGATITGIPAGSVLTIGEQTFEVDDGEADIEGYTGIVKIKCWPYLDAEVTL